MLKKILMILVPVLALVAGTVGGDFLRPKTDDAAKDGHETTAEGDAAAAEGGEAGTETASAEGSTQPKHEAGSDEAPGWFSFSSQFFVPMMRNGDMGAIMVLTLSLETTQGELSNLEAMEHRLRDALLRQLLIAANTGGFDGNFTSEAKLRPLRKDLLNAVQKAGGTAIKAVLIEDIARQGGNS